MDFSIDTAILRDALAQIFTKIDICPSVIEQFSLRYIQAHKSGSPRAEQQAAYDTILKTQWTWHEFDKWHSLFSQQKKWPYLWRQQRLNELPDDESYKSEYWQQRILRILVHTISMRAYAIRDEQLKIGNGMKERFADDVGDECEVEAMICKQFNAGDLKGLPPFFPGDRTSLVDEQYIEILKEYEDE
jgi:hypothetical protein